MSLSIRAFVIPEDVEYVVPAVLSHRLILSPQARLGGRASASVIRGILSSIKKSRRDCNVGIRIHAGPWVGVLVLLGLFDSVRGLAGRLSEVIGFSFLFFIFASIAQVVLTYFFCGFHQNFFTDHPVRGIPVDYDLSIHNQSPIPSSRIICRFSLSCPGLGGKRDRTFFGGRKKSTNLAFSFSCAYRGVYAVGIRFRFPLSKGDWIIVYYKDGTPIVPGKVLDYLAGGPDPSGKIQELADRLGQNKTPSEKVDTLMEYLGANFRYRTKPRGGDPSGVMERFLFDEKEGFCLHFAGAFVILARRMGIPALLGEGYRVNLDDRGQGIVRGTDSHAWAQIYLDGRWRRMDPTPPAFPSTPTVNPVSAVLGDVKKIGVSIDVSWLCIILGTAILGGSVFLIRWVIFERSEAARLRRRARRMVREGKRESDPRHTSLRSVCRAEWIVWSASRTKKGDT